MTGTKKYKDAGLLSLGVLSGVFAAVVVNRMLAANIPVPMWLVQVAAGAGVVVLSTQQKAELNTFLLGHGVGHAVTGMFGGLKAITGSTSIPTINGMKGLNNASMAELPSGDPSAMVEDNIVTLSGGEMVDYSMF